MTLSSRRAAKCRGLSEGECGICGCLDAFRDLCVAPKSSKGGVTDSISAISIASFLPLTGRADFANPLCHPSPNLRIFRWGRGTRGNSSQCIALSASHRSVARSCHSSQGGVSSPAIALRHSTSVKILLPCLFPFLFGGSSLIPGI